MSYKLKVSRSSFRMHMRNRTSSSRPVCVTSRRPEKGLCRSDYRYQFISFILRLLIKTSMVACLTARQAESRPCTVLVFPVRSRETLHSRVDLPPTPSQGWGAVGNRCSSHFRNVKTLLKSFQIVFT